MSNIIVDYNAPIKDGTEIIFRSPVDCSQVTGLKVNYNGDSKEFIFADAHGNNVGDIDHLFAENAVVKVILDVVTGMAFVQNPDTNSYLEYRFDLLADSIVEEATGSTITLENSSNHELQGLKIYGNYTEEKGVVGESGSMTVNVMGKNLLDLSPIIGTSVSANGGTLVCGEDGGITCSGTLTGYVGFNSFRLNLPKTELILSVSGTSENVSCAVELRDATGATLATFNHISSKYWFGTKIDIREYPNYAYATVSIKRNNNVAMSGTAYFQIEVGDTFTAYEQYKGMQTLIIPTPNGLDASDGKCDEIDFAKGVYIKRVGIDGEEETPLPNDVLSAYAKLHTFKPNTIIINDYDAEMSVEYVADTKMYIDNSQKSNVSAIISNNVLILK